MPDRATYLARTILSRVRSLEGVLSEDGVRQDADRAARRAQLIEKILAIEEGVTSGATVRLVSTALPRVTSEQATSDREVDEFASFIRRELKL